MIVRHAENGWEVVFQSAHALLAGRVANQLRRRNETLFWFETLAAIIDHDDLKESFGKNVYITELGAPKDFTCFELTANERFAEAKRRIESGNRKHRWIGLLASKHVETLYGNETISQELTSLLIVERSRRKSVLQDLNALPQQLDAAYEILNFSDRVSLILCQAGLPAMGRRIEITTLADGTRYEMWESDEGTVRVEPWPFEQERFELGLEVRTVRQLAFAHDLELEDRLLACPVEHRVWHFSK